MSTYTYLLSFFLFFILFCGCIISDYDKHYGTDEIPENTPSELESEVDTTDEEVVVDPYDSDVPPPLPE